MIDQGRNYPLGMNKDEGVEWTQATFDRLA